MRAELLTTAHERVEPTPTSTAPKPLARRAIIAGLVLAIFVLGIALGEALNDGPPAPSTETYVRTLEPVPQQPATTIALEAGRSELFGGLQQPGDDHGDRCDEADPDPDAPTAKKKSSGFEIVRMRTMIVAAAPRKIVSRLSGTVAGI